MEDPDSDQQGPPAPTDSARKRTAEELFGSDEDDTTPETPPSKKKTRRRNRRGKKTTVSTPIPVDSNPDDPQDAEEDRAEWESRKIKEVLHYGGALTWDQMAWAMRNVGVIRTWNPTDLAALAESCPFVILMQPDDEDPTDEVEALQDLLIEHGNLDQVLEGAGMMKRLMEKTFDRGINPFNFGPKGPRQDERGREFPGDQLSHFELNAFEQTFRSGTRERSETRHELDGTFKGRRGEVKLPKLNVSPDLNVVDTAPAMADPEAAQTALLRRLHRQDRVRLVPGDSVVIATYNNTLRDTEGEPMRHHSKGP
jgi:hypothetical protein